MNESGEIPIPQQNTEPLPRLLVVDDQPVNIQVLYEIFHRDHEVFMATSGRQALDLCRNNPPDLILLDVVMPELGGMEVCRLLKQNCETKDIPIIFVTAMNSSDDETAGFEAGAVDFITKPVNSVVVRARVHTHLTIKYQADLLRSLVFIDGLTGVANRRRFDEYFKEDWDRCKRHKMPLALFMIDIDYFKKYNDLYGHQAGDDCLQKVVSVLSERCRSYDLVARYGGEEFVCLLSGIVLSNALEKAEKVVRALFEQAIPHGDSEIAPVVTISLGVAVVIPDDIHRTDELLAAADAQLYNAKESGRNRVCGVEMNRNIREDLT